MHALLMSYISYVAVKTSSQTIIGFSLPPRPERRADWTYLLRSRFVVRFSCPMRFSIRSDSTCIDALLRDHHAACRIEAPWLDVILCSRPRL